MQSREEFDKVKMVKTAGVMGIGNFLSFCLGAIGDGLMGSSIKFPLLIVANIFMVMKFEEIGKKNRAGGNLITEGLNWGAGIFGKAQNLATAAAPEQHTNLGPNQHEVNNIIRSAKNYGKNVISGGAAVCDTLLSLAPNKPHQP